MSELGRIGAYRLLAELGRGGAGTVYRAVDPTGTPVALKVLTPGGSDAAGVERFLREAGIRFEHPNVVRTLGGGLAADGRPYVVLELLRGESLRTAFAHMTPPEVIESIRQVALGVGAIHAKGMVHRDLKPENLFRCEDGTTKVLDLGIATFVDGRAKLTKTGTVVGTPAYLAPEQARGDGDVDARADVWALGAVLYEGLSGRSPFRRAGVLATMLAVSVDPVPTLVDVAPDVPRAVAAVVHRCLDRTIGQRYANGAELARALEAAMRGDEEREATAPLAVARKERRAVALVLAQPSAIEPFAAIVTSHAGEPIVLRDGRAIGLFGGAISRGDESRRALAAARQLVHFAPLVALGVGRADIERGSPTGAVVQEAETALTRATTRSGIVCGPATRRAVAEIAATVEAGPSLFEVTDALRGPAASVLLGREAELATLRRARDVALAEHRVVTSWIVGPPGSGKTRLAEEVPTLAAEATPEMRVFDAAAGASSRTAFSVWTRALDVELSRPSSELLDPTARIDHAREEVMQALVAAAVEGPLAITLEDMQWGDGPSIELLGTIEERLEGHAVWLVVTARPELAERVPAVLEGSFHVTPSGLTARDAVQLASAREYALDLRQAQALVEATAGNPLFLDLLIQTLAASPQGSESIEGWRSLELPASIEHAVQARMDQLPQVEREAFIRLAILGWPGSVAEVEALLGASAGSALDALARRGLVTRGTHQGVPVFRPQSALVAQIAASLPAPAERRAIHRLAADVGITGARDDELVASHLEDAGDPGAACAVYLRAMRGAVNGGDARKVVRCAARALACDEPQASSFALHFARAEAARWTGEPAVQEQALDAAERFVEGDVSRARLESERGDWLRRRGRTPEAIACLDRAIGLAAVADEPEVLALAVCRRATIWAADGHAAEARDALAALEPHASTLAGATAALARDTAGFIAGCVGDHAERQRAFADAARLYARIGDLRRSAGAELNAADASNRLGDFRDAERALRRGLVATRRVGNRLTEGYGLMNLGYTLLALGRGAEAIEAIEQALRIGEHAGDPVLRAATQLYLCRAAPERPGTEDVLAALAADRGMPTIAAGALVLSSERARGAGDVARARALAMEALGIRDARGALEEGEGEVFLAAIRAARAAGDEGEARALATRGAARAREIAACVTDAAARARLLEQVPEYRELLREAG